MEAETGAMCIPAKENQGSWQPPEAGERHGMDFLVEPPGTNTADAWISTPGFQNCARIRSCSFKPLGLW